MLFLENQESSQEVEPVEIEEDENLKNISTDLKELIQFLKDNKIESDKIAEAEKQIQLEADNQQIELDEQKELIQTENEQELIDSEIEFRENLIQKFDVSNSKLDEIITYNSNSDGISEKIDSTNQKMDLIIENTEFTEKQQINEELSYYSNLSLIFIVFVCIPVFVAFKVIKPFFNKFY